MDYNDIEYIKQQYKLLNLNENTTNWFNPNIYPTCDNNLFIPKCSSCKSDYETFRSNTFFQYEMNISWNHPQSCLWYSYYTSKITNFCSKPNFIKKKKN